MPPRHARQRRVVVTGIGCVTPLGCGAAATWQAAVAGKSGIRPITSFETDGFPVRIAGEVRDELDLGNISRKEARRLDRMIALAVAAAREAVEDADLSQGVDHDRAGVAIGSGIGGLGALEASFDVLARRGPTRISPFMIPMIISNMAGGYVSILHGLRGPNLCHVSACATGAHSIGEAARIIERGDADLMLAGGSEAANTKLGVAGFTAMRALSMRNDDPAAASRPFDVDRDGFVMSEGAAVLVLEEAEAARARGATARAEFLGYGLSADAVHMAIPTEHAEGAQRCMRLALADAELGPTDVDYLNAHATSTPAGDPSEVRAVRSVFESHVNRLAVSATKSMTGHLLGAAGALEALLCVRSLETQTLPPTINLDCPDPECDLDHVANKARETRVDVALSNSFGFGGTNATLIFGRC
ncbi:MAG: beta-ketoacyl-ACP synthase II [Myxococcota bacterium]|nr:beta-ketoacyl-[acyl-carrier-protein] synthase II [Deltaproteobacteria bacterium]MCP4244967.1 beta-ketoacyl-ACP synthase II [bacterium]MDP6076221.1 beta-ketoacyl-ACP synthase II [Myxococcota bacterium]MDP7074927.1 beta-ketoacyl-ACP synthase II [Myxococcota bacterium]MDP7298971.1 beta-ketoacyl-ACP synthase II [Myxococcota bacterium]